MHVLTRFILPSIFFSLFLFTLPKTGNAGENNTKQHTPNPADILRLSTYEDFNSISEPQKITSLTIMGPNFRAERDGERNFRLEFFQKNDFSSLTNLKLLHVHMGKNQLIHLANLKNLKRLSLEYSNVTDEEFKQAIPTLSNLKKLEELDLHETYNISTLKVLDGLNELKSLRYYNGNNLDVDVPSLPKLKQLELTESFGGKITNVHFSKNLIELQELNLRNNYLRDDALKNFSTLSKSKLQSLDLSGNLITGSGLSNLVDLVHLQVLNLSCSPYYSLCNGPTNNGIKNLFGHPNFKAPLQKLYLDLAPISNRSLSYLSKLTELKYLSLYKVPGITDDGLINLGALSNLEHLNLSMDLRDGPITGSHFNHLRNLTKLKHLDLSAQSINDNSCLSLSRLPALEYLSLWNARVTDECVRLLRDAPSLKSLVLTSNEITDNALTHFNSLPKLQYLYLNATKVTKTGVEKFLSTGKTRLTVYIPKAAYLRLEDGKIEHTKSCD